MVKNNISFKKALFFLLAVCLSLSLIFPPFVLAQIQDVVDSKDADNVLLYPGDLVTVKVKSLTRIAVANPGIVDIANATADEITLVGRTVGETQIFVWEETGKRTVVAHVLATDLNHVANRIASLVQSAGIKGVLLEKNYNEGKIIISGYLSKNEKKKLDEIIKAFDASVMNLVIEEGDLIQIDVQFSELDTTLSKTLGFDWTTRAFTFSETLPTQDGSLSDLFKLGDFSRTSAIVSVVNLLIQEGKGRILSKPSLVVTNGEEASFLVGGEIPIRTTTTAVSGGSVQENVTFKDYGVELKVTPEIRDGKIDIKVNVTVRDIDSSNGVGNDVAFLTRTATTKVRLSDAQTIVLAGMIQRRQSETVKRVPYLSKIPVVGMLFRSKGTTVPDSDQELVVSLTPHILKNAVHEKVKQDSGDQKAGETLKTEGVEAVSGDGNKSSDIKTMSVAAKVEESKLASESKEVKEIKNDEIKPKAEVKEVKPEAVKPAAEIKEEKAVIKKSTSQIAAEKKAAQKKAKAEARAAAEKLKKEKAEKLKREKEEKAQAKKKIKNDGKQKGLKAKVIENKSIKEQTVVKGKMGEVVVKSAEQKDISQKAVDDPSLNISLDDPRIKDPQNILSDGEVAAIKEKYSNKVRNQMIETISYPYEAKESHWEGTTVLNITILPSGDVKNVAVSQSSGYAIFDKDAVNTAEILSPFDSFIPAKNLRELVISVPVEYSEKAILGTSAEEKK